MEHWSEVKYKAPSGSSLKKKKKKKIVVMIPIKHLQCTVKCTIKQLNTVFSYVNMITSLAKLSKTDGFQDKSNSSKHAKILTSSEKSGFSYAQKNCSVFST